MTVITIGQRKGGVGKSTATLNLSCVLAEKGFRVLIIDLDDQQNTTMTTKVNNDDLVVRQARSISSLVDSSKTIEDLLLKDDVTLNDVAVQTAWQNVYILPSSANLSGAVKALDGELGGHLVLSEKLRSSSDNEKFDFVLIDTSPSLNILVINALCASDYLFIPLSSKYFSMQCLKQTLESFQKVTGRLNPHLKLLGIAFVCHDKRHVLANEVVEQIKGKYEDKLFKTLIGVNIKIEEAQVRKQSILEYSPEDRGAIQYRELGEEVLKRVSTTEGTEEEKGGVQNG